MSFHRACPRFTEGDILRFRGVLASKWGARIWPLVLLLPPHALPGLPQLQVNTLWGAARKHFKNLPLQAQNQLVSPGCSCTSDSLHTCFTMGAPGYDVSPILRTSSFGFTVLASGCRWWLVCWEGVSKCNCFEHSNFPICPCHGWYLSSLLVAGQRPPSLANW